MTIEIKNAIEDATSAFQSTPASAIFDGLLYDVIAKEISTYSSLSYPEAVAICDTISGNLADSISVAGVKVVEGIAAGANTVATVETSEFRFDYTQDDAVAWLTWDENMRSKASKSHFEDIDREGYTLCGVMIPDSGDGIEIVNGEDGSGECKRCAKKAAA